ncbi:unnamed protein product [Rhizoctonia solani]|uniref:DUF7918 domain-containing protein n=1 Tax=Rhizoctonia solani TaxID=456999 RepID=A0A8H2XWE7_9AGAM|nr:unnamed protein product [Rhizoctonia solani]
MRFEKHGLSVWITDSEDNELTEYQVQEGSDNTIQCWIPSTNGSSFKILWKILRNPHPELDLRSTPYLDGVRMTASVWSKGRVFNGNSGKHYQERTGVSTARLYEFGRRTLTDNDDCPNSNQSLLKNLNTIKLIFDWGQKGKGKPRERFHVPQELGPIHEKAAKKGHSGAAKLGQTINVSNTCREVSFKGSKMIKPITFVFCYAPEDWLQARDIIPRSPESDSQDTKVNLKRERSATPEIVDVDELETDDDEIQIIKHMIPAPESGNKRRKTSGTESDIRPKDEGDQES